MDGVHRQFVIRDRALASIPQSIDEPPFPAAIMAGRHFQWPFSWHARGRMPCFPRRGRRTIERHARVSPPGRLLAGLRGRTTLQPRRPTEASPPNYETSHPFLYSRVSHWFASSTFVMRIASPS